MDYFDCDSTTFILVTQFFSPVGSMEQQSKIPKRRVGSRGAASWCNWILGILITIATLTTCFYYIIVRNPSTGTAILCYAKALPFWGQTENNSPVSKPGKTDQVIYKKVKSVDQDTVSGIAKITGESNTRPLSITAMSTGEQTELADSSQPASINENQAEPSKFSGLKGQQELQSLLDEINAFYSHLDKQSYMTDFNLPEPAQQYFSKLIQKLLDNPPVVSRETDDLFTLLRNTAHFFRVLGKKNILILKGILDREKESFEKNLMAFYTLTSYPQELTREYGITLSQESLYDYAAFFIHTMGGRMYLFRRDSSSRLAVSYYSILIIDHGNATGNSPHGIDIKPPLNALIEELENGGKKLKLHDEYLNTLYTLYDRYNK